MMHRIILLEKTGGGDREQDTPPARSFSMNFDLVLQKIQDLNVLTGEGQRFIHKTASGAKLYRNGIEMFDGHFRSFQEQSTQLCMQDLVDDCFPSELQQRFPDGVPFEVQDRRHETFLVRLPWDTCPGEGRAVYEEKDEEFTNAVSLQSPGLTWSRLLPTILVFHLGSQEEADHRSEKAAKDGGQSRCGDRHQEFSEGDCRFRLILGAQRLLWTHLVAEGRYSAVKEHLLKLSSR
nr:UBX domain-containing protein 11 isoform X2 [Nothobranchius furzeri]XP_054596431.1 UBX domain-containing protein 11 isoform X2 [Nothobranchius furzeri]